MNHQGAPQKGAFGGAQAAAGGGPAEAGQARPGRMAAWIVGLVPAWVTPNHLTILRMTGTLAILALGLSQAPLGWLVAIGLVSGLSDNLDGAVARVRGQVTELGAFLDPLADKLFAAVLMVVLWWRGLADWRLLLLAAAMDLHALVIPLLAFWRRWRQGRRLRPAPKVRANIWGKYKTAVLAWSMGFIVMGHAFDQPWLAVFGTYTIWLAVGLGLVAMYRYFTAFAAGEFD